MVSTAVLIASDGSRYTVENVVTIGRVADRDISIDDGGFRGFTPRSRFVKGYSPLKTRAPQTGPRSMALWCRMQPLVTVML